MQVAVTQTEVDEDLLYRKVTRKVVWLLFFLFVLSFIDRVNVGYAKLQFSHDLNFSNTIYGIGAGVFFIGYFLFEIPSNLLLEKIGARATMSRIMILWGAISCCMMFMKSEWAFYTLRFLLGAAEAGFFPGVILFLTYWFPNARRAKATAIFYAAVPVAGIVGPPLSGYLMTAMDSLGGLRGWQWMFLLEGLPSVIMGLAILFFSLIEKPENAKWLTPQERAVLLRNLEADKQTAVRQGGHAGFLKAMASPKLWLFVAIYFCITVANSGYNFWLPQIVRDLGVTNTFHNGLIVAIPYIVAGVGMYFVGKSSDRLRERRLHFTFCCLGTAVCLTACALFKPGLALSMVLLSVGYIGVLSGIVVFWPMPSAYLMGTAAAGGIALINSLGNLASYVNNNVMGFFRDTFGSVAPGLLFISASLTVSALLVFLTQKPRHAPAPAASPAEAAAPTRG
jgi:MFS family permease